MESRKKALVSIPKNASRSICEALGLKFYIDYDEPIRHSNHKKAKLLNIEGHWSFCFSRNPYKRTKSWFHYHRRLKPYNRFHTIDEWIRQGMPHHWLIQGGFNWIKEQQTPLLQWNFLEGFGMPDFVGKIENFEEDLKYVLNVLDIDIPIDYKAPEVNRRNHDLPLNAKSIDTINDLLQKDFEVFGYSIA